MSVLTVLVALGLIVYIIGQQVVGTPLRGRRVVLLPAILVVIGIVQLGSSKVHPDAMDVVLLLISAAVAIVIGVTLGLITRLERRNGHLWGQLPKSGLWLWAALIITRIAVTAIAHATGADLAASTDAILLTLGLNRAAQALIVVPRAIQAGIPFAPEKDGKVFAGSWFGLNS